MTQREITSILRQSRPPQILNDPGELSEKLGMTQELAQKINEISNQPQINILNDQPARKDVFGFDAIVRTLADIILSETTQTPITISVDGEWGTGKTSILRMLEVQARSLQYPCIWLNAWSLESADNLNAAIASGIKDEIELLGEQMRVRKEPLLERLSRVLSEAVVAFLSEFTLPALSTVSSGSGNLLKSASGLAKATLEREREITELATIVTTSHSFEQFIQPLLDLSGHEEPRLIVFIDDIDRALPDQVTTILKNLKLILEIPSCVFVLAMDMSIVARLIEEHYKSQGRNLSLMSLRNVERSNIQIFTGSEEMVGEGFGNKYLEKLVQIRVGVPALTRDAVYSYLDEIGIISEVLEIIRWAPDGEVLNPRRLKRYINWLSISLQLIMSVPKPTSFHNVTALRAMALQRDYPKIHKSLLNGSEPDLESFVARRNISKPSEANDFRSYIHKIPQNELIMFDEFVRRTPILEVDSSGYRSPQIDLYYNYEIGIKRLLQELGQAHPQYLNALVYEHRLLENIARSRQFGDTETGMSERSEIIHRLNELALSTLNVTFNDLYK